MAYNRKYQLKITPLKLVGNSVVDAGKPIVITDPLTISFNISREPWAGACSATINIYNLEPATRKKMFLDYYSYVEEGGMRRVELYAGYENGKYGLIYRGFIKTCLNKHEHTENITTIESFSGLYVLDQMVSTSIGVAESQENIAKTIGENMTGVSGGTQSFDIKSTTRPVPLIGNSIALLKTYTKGNSVIDNEELVILKEDEAIEGLVRVIDDETGLLGSPERMDRSVKVTCIFEPRIQIGQAIEIRSKTEPAFDGQYKVWGIQHSGTMGLAASGQCTTTLTLWTGYQLFGRFKNSFAKIVGSGTNV